MIVHEECGCKHDHIQWVEMCGTCRKESDEVRARWEEQRKKGIPLIVYRKNGVVQQIVTENQSSQVVENIFEACL